MRSIRKVINVISMALFLTTFSSLSDAEVIQNNAMTTMQSKIYMTVMAPGGYITEELYNYFWMDMPKEMRNSREARKEYSNSQIRIKKYYDKFRLEGLKSAKLSLGKNKIVKTADYEFRKSEFLKLFGLYADDYNNIQHVHEMDKMIEAAARGIPYQTPQGALQLTEKNIDAMIEDQNASSIRYGILLSPDWTDNEIFISYSELKISVKTKYPLYEREIDAGNGDKIKVLTFRFDEKNTLAIRFINLKEPLQDPAKDVPAILQKRLEAMGKVTSNITSDSWYGLATSKGTTRSDKDGVISFTTMKIINMKSNSGYLIIGTVSEQNEEESKKYMDYIEERIKL